MKSIDRETAETLIQHRGGPCLSIYLPCVKAGPEVRQNPIRFKNQLREAREKLEARGVSEADQARLLEPLEPLTRDQAFWNHVDHGFAWLATPEAHHRIDLPFEVETRAEVGDRFHVTPLVSALGDEGDFCVVALALDGSSVHRGTRHQLLEVELVDTPTSVNEAKGYQLIPEDLRRPMRGAPAGHVGAGESVVQGQSAGEINRWRNARKFLHLFDRGVTRALGADPAPVVLAGVERVVTLYRDVTALDPLDAAIYGAVRDLDEGALREKAWQVVRDVRRGEVDRELKAALSSLGTEQATGDLDEVLAAAHDGRIARLFVARQSDPRGTYNPVERKADRGEGGELLSDRAVSETWTHGGKVHVVDPERLPNDAVVLATLRY